MSCPGDRAELNEVATGEHAKDPVRVSPLILLAALWSAPPSPSPAERPDVQRPSQLHLGWTGPNACPDADEVRERLRARLPTIGDPLPRGVVPLDVEVSLVAVDAGFEASVVLSSGASSHARTLASRDCSLLTDAIVLVVAVALDPITTAAEVARREAAPIVEAAPAVIEDEPARPTEPEPEPRDTSMAVSLPAADDDPTTASSLQVGLRVLGGGGFGPTNTAYASLAGSVALLGPRWRAAVDGRWAVRRTVVLPSGAGGRFDAWLVGAVGCFVPARRRLEFPLCAGIEAGQVRGAGLPSLAVVDEASFPFAALRLSPGLAWVPIDRLALGFDLELAAPLTRGEFVIDAAVVQRVVPVTVRGMLGVELRLP